ncbi:MAG: hypothetical protein KKH94_04125, partial [Candidatus Omnitrophica bacterium]|nr:hypothetical protein [Candidatus Omnitrophota bacterium]
MIKRMSIIALLSVTLCMSAGCGAKLNPYNAVHNYQYEYAVQKFRKVANAQAKKKKIGRNYSLPFLHLASASFQGGGYALAEEALSEALPLMERIQEDTSKNIAAIMGTEDNRQYKGDPYERAMAHFYLGLIRYYHGEYDRALALFRRSLVDDMDTNSSQESDLEDFAIVSLMAAKSYALLDEPDNARVMLDKVSSYVTDPSAFTEFREHFLTDNFTMLIGDGVGPYKTSVGAGRAAIRIMSVPSPVATIQIIIDDVDLGNALLCSNVVDQASAHTASGGR